MTDEHHEVQALRRRQPATGPGTTLVVVVACLVAVAGGGAFAWALVTHAGVTAQGSAAAVAFLALAVAVRRAFAASYPRIEAVQWRRDPQPSPGPIADVAPLPRRRLLLRLVAGAGGLVGLSLLAPVAALDRRPRRDVPSATAWRAGVRLLDSDGVPIHAGDVPDTGVATAWPEGVAPQELAAVIVVRVPGGPRPPTRLEWTVGGDLVAYSKICTHAGCPVGLFQAGAANLLCPCHQAQFDAAEGARPVFGPASRPLPQLPLGVDAEGYLMAIGDFDQPVGPSTG